MRTTLTIDDDVARLIQEEVRRSGGSLKSTVNGLLRKGLCAAKENKARERFVVTPLPLGLQEGLSYDKVEALIEALEGPMHR